MTVDRVLLAIIVCLFLCLAAAYYGWNNTITERDGWRDRANGFVHQVATTCTVHTDGSMECPAGTMLTTTTTAP